MSEAQASSEPLADAAVPAQADVAADTAVVLAALGRLEAAVRDGREVLTRLRGCLADMANAIVKAKAMADSPAAISLLNEFEHRIDVMIEIAGGEERRAVAAEQPEADAAAAEHDEAAAAESDEVPTVSGVVSRLGASGGEAPSPAADTPDGGLVDASNVAKLTAMVQALRDSMPPEEPQLAAAPEAASPPQGVEPAAAESAGPPPHDASAAVSSPEPEPEPEPASPSEPEAPTVSTARVNMAASLPQPEFVAMSVETAVEPRQDAPPAQGDQADPVQPAHDPLRALKAMSENERLALFS